MQKMKLSYATRQKIFDAVDKKQANGWNPTNEELTEFILNFK